MTPLIRRAMVHSDSPEACVWFDISSAVVSHAPIEELLSYELRTPFELVTLVGATSDGRLVTVWCHDSGNTVTATMHREGRPGPITVEFFTYASGASGVVVRESRYPRKASLGAAYAMCRLLRAIETPGALAYRAVPSSKNPQRAKRGKKPLYDWTTVTIEPRAPKAEPKGGTHASPRAHDRRGHWVTRKSGLRYWRRHCRVGNPANGFVFHDYLVKERSDVHP